MCVLANHTVIIPLPGNLSLIDTKTCLKILSNTNTDTCSVSVNLTDIMPVPKHWIEVLLILINVWRFLPIPIQARTNMLIPIRRIGEVKCIGIGSKIQYWDLYATDTKFFSLTHIDTDLKTLAKSNTSLKTQVIILWSRNNVAVTFIHVTITLATIVPFFNQSLGIWSY